MVMNVTKKPHGAEPPAAVHAAAGGALLSLAADTLSVAASSSPATPVVASARGDSSREVDPFLVVDYECESDEMADSGRLEQSPDCHRVTDYEFSNDKFSRVGVFVACLILAMTMSLHRQ